MSTYTSSQSLLTRTYSTAQVLTSLGGFHGLPESLSGGEGDGERGRLLRWERENGEGYTRKRGEGRERDCGRKEKIMRQKKTEEKKREKRE